MGIAIALAALLVYLPVYRGEFLFDDWFIIHDRELNALQWKKLVWRVRGLSWLSFAFDRWRAGEVRADRTNDAQILARRVHETNIVLHGGSAILASVVVETIVPGWGWIGGVAFAVHPLASSAVAYASARTSLLAGFLSLASIALVVTGHPLWAVVPMGLAIYSKEDAAILPVTLSILVSRWSLLYLGILVLGLWKYQKFILAHIHKGTVKSGWAEYGIPMLTGWDYRFAFLVEHGIRLPLWILGFGFNADPDVKKPTVVEIALVGCFAATLGVLIFQISPIALLFLLAAPLSLYFFVENPDVVFEYRAYLCTLGISVLFARAAPFLPVVLLVAILDLWIVAALLRSYYWSNWIVFWSEITRKSPLKMRGWLNLGLGWRVRGEWNQARSCAEQARALFPQSAMPLEHLAWLADGDQDLAKAKKLLEAAVKVGPRSFMAWRSLGQIEARLGHPAKAEDCFRKALAVNPKHEVALFLLGNLLLEQKRPQEALPYLKDARRIRPDLDGYQQLFAIACHLSGEDPGDCPFRVTGVETVKS